MEGACTFDGPGHDKPSLQGNLVCRKGWIQFTKNYALGMGNPTCPSCCFLPLVLRVRTPPLRNLPRGAPGQAGSRRLVAVASVRKQNRWSLYRMPRQLQRLRTRTQGVGPRQGWELLPECARTSAFATPPCRSSLGSLCWGLRLSHLWFSQGCHLTGCDSSLGHPFRPMQCGTYAGPQHCSSEFSSSNPSTSLAAKPLEVGVQERSRRAKSLLVQASLWAHTTDERDIILEAVAERPDPSWPHGGWSRGPPGISSRRHSQQNT